MEITITDLYIIFFLYLALNIVLFYIAKKRNSLYIADISIPFLILWLWYTITRLGYGHQSLSHIIEIPILLIIALLLQYLRIFILNKYFNNTQRNSIIIFFVSVLMVLIIRTFMPYLAE